MSIQPVNATCCVTKWGNYGVHGSHTINRFPAARFQDRDDDKITLTNDECKRWSFAVSGRPAMPGATMAMTPIALTVCLTSPELADALPGHWTPNPFCTAEGCHIPPEAGMNLFPMDDLRPDPDALVAAAAREGRGRLKVFLGAAPGVGKTWEMLSQARRRQAEGAWTCWPASSRRMAGRRRKRKSPACPSCPGASPSPYRGQALEEFDLDAALARRPRPAAGR